MADRFEVLDLEAPVRGYLHPAKPTADSLVLTHGAGGNCDSPLLCALGDAFAHAGVAVLRCNLPFRQARPSGPPRPSDAAQDRLGLKSAVTAMKKLFSGRSFLGGQSYGGRQATLLVAENIVVDGLLLLSYPLHPPGKPKQLRTEHFPRLKAKTLFVHGTRDPFGSISELSAALAQLGGPSRLIEIANAGHGLVKGKSVDANLIATIHRAFCEFLI